MRIRFFGRVIYLNGFQKILLIIAAFCLCAIVGFFITESTKVEGFPVEMATPDNTFEIVHTQPPTLAPTPYVTPSPVYYPVHVTGCVNNPSVVWVEESYIIQDVIELAGGITSDADIESVNLAAAVQSNMKIRIPSIYDEDKRWLLSTGFEITSGDNGGYGEKDGIVIVNINTASQSELVLLNGIGPATAQRIIDHREANGLFECIEEIMDVTGIGEKKFEGIKDYITVE